MNGMGFFSGVMIDRSFVQWGLCPGAFALCRLSSWILSLAIASYLLSAVDISHQSNRKKTCKLIYTLRRSVKMDFSRSSWCVH